MTPGVVGALASTLGLSPSWRNTRAGFERAPFPGAIGERVQREICTVCWGEWNRQQMMLINHYGLNLMDPQARQFLTKNMDAFLFGAGAGAIAQVIVQLVPSIRDDDGRALHPGAVAGIRRRPELPVAHEHTAVGVGGRIAIQSGMGGELGGRHGPGTRERLIFPGYLWPVDLRVDLSAIEAVLPEIHLPRPVSEDSFLPAGN